jgi:PIN domain nuclease of toxin-antitoxin system
MTPSMVLLDTMAVIWSAVDGRELGSTARAFIQELNPSSVTVSAVSFWEIGTLTRKKRLNLGANASLAGFRAAFLYQGCIEVGLSGEIVLAAHDLEDFHKDPADRFIVATALALDLTLITSDKKILTWPGPLKRLDARS